jgi:hypothetical protein
LGLEVGVLGSRILRGEAIGAGDPGCGSSGEVGSVRMSPTRRGRYGAMW